MNYVFGLPIWSVQVSVHESDNAVGEVKLKVGLEDTVVRNWGL